MEGVKSRLPQPGGPAPTAAQGVPARPTMQLDHVPSRSELLDLPQGVQFQTPYGSVDENGNLTPNPEGDAKYREALVERQRKFGPHPWAGDPNAPPPPVALGKPAFNPITGRWLE